MSSCAIQTTSLAIANARSKDPREQTRVMGLIFISNSIGISTSPILGSMLYESGGFNIPFYTFGIIFIILFFLSIVFIDKSVDGEPKDESEEQFGHHIDTIDIEHAQTIDSVRNMQPTQLNVFTLLTSLKTLFPIILGCSVYFCWCEIEPILPLQLKEKYGM